MFSELGGDVSVFRLGGQVRVFQRIVRVVIEFLRPGGSATVPGVTVATVREGVIHVFVGGQRGSVPLFGRIGQERRKS